MIVYVSCFVYMYIYIMSVCGAWSGSRTGGCMWMPLIYICLYTTLRSLSICLCSLSLVHKHTHTPLYIGHTQTTQQPHKYLTLHLKSPPHSMGINLHLVDATDLFLGKLAGVTDPETKRKIIGNTFIEVFDEVRRDIDVGWCDAALPW